MAISVDLQNPPAFAVVVSFFEGEREIPVTWPFATQAEAAAAYEVAVQSGQFTRRFGRGKGASSVTLVSCWRREHHPHVRTGEPVLVYVGCEPWHREPAGC